MGKLDLEILVGLIMILAASFAVIWLAGLIFTH